MTLLEVIKKDLINLFDYAQATLKDQEHTVNIQRHHKFMFEK